jgi:hypothetical protein
MFTPLNPEYIEATKKKGIINFFVFDGWEYIAAHSVFTTVPHKIVYSSKDRIGHYIDIFDCKLTLEKYRLLVENIEKRKDIDISKPAEYMFLGMAVDAVGTLAEFSRKMHIVITSKIPMFPEIASEMGYNIEKNRFSSYFSAKKTIVLKRTAGV